MGCCHTKVPPAPRESAFKEFSANKQNHHVGDSNYTMSSQKSNGEGKGYYHSNYDKIKNLQPTNGTDELATLHNPSSSSSSLNDNDNVTKQLIKKKNKKNNQKTDEKPSNPLTYDNRSNLSAGTATTATATSSTRTNTQNTTTKQSNTINIPRERESSVSKSRSRQFRNRTEPNSPSLKAANDTKETKEGAKHNHDDDNDDQKVHLPNFEEDSRASSLSGEFEIPGLQLLSEDSSDEEDDDVFTNKMALIVQQENRRLEEEIIRMKSFIDETEIKRLEEEAKKEIEAEAKDNNLADREEEQKRKLRERFEKK
eukprot:537025_1